MAENKNQISTEEWSERMRRGSGSASSPSSISRAPANVSGPLTQLKSNLDSLAKQRYGLAMGNVTRQYNLAERMNQATAELGANTVARRDKLYANRQDNLNRMSQLYGQYYQQFGGVLNESALRFLDKHSSISVPTLTAIMAGYEHARASRAEQELAMLDRKSKMLDAQWAVQDKIVETQQMADTNKHAAAMQTLEAQSKAAQATYDAQKAYLDEQARNEMLGAGLASGARGTGVRALPGIGGVGGGARAGVGRVPSAVTGARSGQTVVGAATPTGRVVQTAEGQTVAVDNNKNVIGTVVPTQNGSVVVNDNGQTVGSVDANGNVMPTQQSLYAQYKAGGGGGLWQDPVESAVGYGVVPLAVSGGAAFLGQNARLGYVDPLQEARYAAYNTGRESLSSAANRAKDARAALRLAINADPNFETWQRTLGSGKNAELRYLDYLKNLQNYGVLSPERQAILREGENLTNATRELNDLRNGIRGVQNYNIQSLGGRQGLAATREAISTANNAGRVARTTGGALRLLGRAGGAQLLARAGSRFVPYLGWGMLAADAFRFGPSLAGAAVAGLGQAGRNILGDLTGTRQEEIATALAEGRPIPVQPSTWQAIQEGWRGGGRLLGYLGYTGGFANPEDVRNFEEFYEQRTGSTLDQDTRVRFDKQNPVTRTVIMDGLLSGEINGIDQVHKFIDDTINTYSNPQEQQAIQQQINQEKRDARFERSTGSNGDHSGVKAVTEDIQNRLAKLGYDYTYDDVMDGANAYLDVLGWYETRNKAGAEGVPTKNGTAKSRWQLMDRNFDTGRKRILKKYGDKLSREDRDLLIKAKDANALDNEYGQPLLAMIVLDNIFEDLAINNEHLDKKGPNIRSDQMFGEIVGMVKMAREDGDVDDQGNARLDPIILGNIGRLGGVVHMRATDQKNVGDWYTNVNNGINEFPGIGFRRNAQGGNDPWWDLGFTPLTRYGELRGRGAQAQQQAPYGFDVAPGVDVDNLNTLLIDRFSAANDAMVAATGVKGRANSGKRSKAKQADLYRNKANNPNPVGRPGYSFHQSGMALDFNNDEWEKAFNGSDQLKHNYGTFDNFLNSFGLQRGVTDKNGKRSDLVHLTMLQDDEYHANIDHDRLMASRGKWGDEHGNYWMRGVGSAPKQVQPAWDVSPQFMVENFGYPTVEYPATDYDPDVIFAGYGDDGYGQEGVVFDYDEYGYPTF